MGAVLPACHTFSSDFLPLGLACSSASGLDLIIPSLFGARKLCNVQLRSRSTQCISYFVSQGEGVLGKKDL